jgi:hypothetical protein
MKSANFHPSIRNGCWRFKVRIVLVPSIFGASLLIKTKQQFNVASLTINPRR